MSLPMISEHESPHDDPSEGDDIYSPTNEEKALVKKLEGLFERDKKAKQKYDYCWVDYYKMFRGKQWKEQRPSYRSSEVFNLIWQAIQSQIPIITDAKPKFEYLPQEPGDREFAELMNEVALADWQSKNWLFTLTEGLYDCSIYGTAISLLKYDTEKDELVYRFTDPFYFFPAASAENMKEKCTHVSHAEPEELDRIKRIFPKFKDYLKADVTDFQSTDNIELGAVKYNNPNSDQLYVEVSGGFENKKTPEVLVKTFYLEDDEVLECEEQDSETGESKYVRKLKYPGGRRVITANEIILDDGPIGYEDEAIFPYQRLVNFISPRQFWGISDLEVLEGPQRAFNKIISYVFDVLYLCGNPIWIVDSTSGVFTDNLTSQPGLVVEKEPGSEVRREAGVQLQPYILNLINLVKDLVEQFSGSQDVSKGIAPGGVTAASAIADLQNAAQTRIRQKMRNLDAYLQDFGQAYASRVMQFYTAPKVFRLTGKDGADKYFKMSIQKAEDGRGHKALVQHYTENGLISPDFKEYYLRGKLDVRVTTGSSLPFNKSENEQRAYNLFDRGIIDGQEVLKILEYPNAEAILSRMEEKAAAQAQADMEAQMQGAPPPAAA